MHPTRRLWAAAGLAAVLAAIAVVLAAPLALLGAAFVGAWLLSRQYLFYRATTTLAEGLAVTHAPAREWVRTDDATPVTLAADLAEPSRLACTVRAGLPTAATTTTDDSLTLSVDPGTAAAEQTAEIRWPVAGRHRFAPATVRVTDGLFTQEFRAGTTPAVTVEPRGPRNVHVGEGGDRVASAYGEHDAGRWGSGIEPAELREYEPGDAADRIDWNATARLGTPYVREFEAETDRTTLLVVDHRAALATGPPAETKLDYLREVALGVVDSARRLDDPLGLLAVGEGGITTRLSPATTQDGYASARRTLVDLDPTAGDAATEQRAVTTARSRTPDGTPENGSSGETPHSSGKEHGPDPDDTSGTATATVTVPSQPLAERRATRTVGDIRQSLAELETDDGPFSATLRPFLADRQHYEQRIASDPLFGAVRATVAAEHGPVFAVLCTDDSAPAELRETVKLARREGGEVLVLLAPTVLYEPGGLADVDGAYRRYVEFEELRRDLARLDGVTALEVGPGDRIATVLAAGRRNRPGHRGGRP